MGMFEDEIRAFEAQDQERPAPRGAIVFAGSSSIRGWDLARHFPGLDVVNRGFGGSQIAESTHYADRILQPLEPRLIVFYAGDNDIACGKTPAEVCDDFAAFVGKIRSRLPETRILFLSIKPSLCRWEMVGLMREANRRIEAFTRGVEGLDYLDLDAPMRGADGMPRRELFAEDGLHLSDEGYALWTALVLPHLR